MAVIDADKLRIEIQLILKDADLNTLSSKKVRQMLERLFDCDFTERKKEIDDILMAEITRENDQKHQDHQDTNNNHPSSTTTSEDDEEMSKTSPSSSKNLKPKKKSQKKVSSPSNLIRDNINGNDNGQFTINSTKSDEELAMEIHQQENRPSLRHKRQSKPIKKNKSDRKDQTPSAPSEKRRTIFHKELDLTDELASIVGGNQMPRSEVVKRMWAYFKQHNLMDEKNKQYVNCDEKLSKLFGRKRVRAFGMLKDLSRHMTDPDKEF
ncbi:unnamed protein product [Didymodactylos carnosus]|uniref:DM2 domain-containing protein n=1 Tax=Didymodactylos carnosus TaxID=1234261 RepID=A0A815UE89_9BILA|nr:unnamed protein product [Didymodactylos carnosus]CAF1518603.1 unnamed protein product [Didymodactylos carnosus]CAF3677066.1 unnamed protein product [Didymodactylos carnosus]CAF4378289.1 unnamed protein product [Didymodactylos carnosus]